MKKYYIYVAANLLKNDDFKKADIPTSRYIPVLYVWLLRCENNKQC